jgi:hypothetical protein
MNRMVSIAMLTCEPRETVERRTTQSDGQLSASITRRNMLEHNTITKRRTDRKALPGNVFKDEVIRI